MKSVIIFSVSNDETARYVSEKGDGRVNFIKFFTDKKRPFDLGKFSPSKNQCLVWNRRPFENALHKNCSVEEDIRFSETSESYWNELGCLGWDNWINPPYVNWVANKKLYSLKIAQEVGLTVPDWLVTNSISKAKAFLGEHDWDCVVKPINHGYFLKDKSLTLIYTNLVRNDFPLSKVKNCPTFFQKRVQKGFDVRTLYILGKVVFVKIEPKNPQIIDVRKNNMVGARYSIVTPPKAIMASYKKLMNAFNLKFCTSDFVVNDRNQWFFLENNPNGQWAWFDSQIDFKFSETFIKAIEGY